MVAEGNHWANKDHNSNLFAGKFLGLILSLGYFLLKKSRITEVSGRCLSLLL